MRRVIHVSFTCACFSIAISNMFQPTFQPRCDTMGVSIGVLNFTSSSFPFPSSPSLSSPSSVASNLSPSSLNTLPPPSHHLPRTHPGSVMVIVIVIGGVIVERPCRSSRASPCHATRPRSLSPSPLSALLEATPCPVGRTNGRKQHRKRGARSVL